jgi:hypothetical protein
MSTTPVIGTGTKPAPEYVEAFQIHNPEFLSWAETDGSEASDPPPELVPIMVNRRVDAWHAIDMVNKIDHISIVSLLPLFEMTLHPDSYALLSSAHLDAPELEAAGTHVMGALFRGN